MSCSSVLLPGVAALRHEICSSGTTNSNTSLGGKPRVLLNRDEHGIVSSRMTPRNVCSWRKITRQLLYSVTHCGLVMSYGDRSRPTLAQIMDCCLMAPSHYLNQCWLIIKGVLWHSPASISQVLMNLIHNKCLEITLSDVQVQLPGSNELNRQIKYDFGGLAQYCGISIANFTGYTSLAPSHRFVHCKMRSMALSNTTTSTLLMHWRYCSLVLSQQSTMLLLIHYNDVIMDSIASQITSLTIVYSVIYLGADQRKHQSSTSLAFVREVTGDRWISRTNGQLRGKCFHLMTSSWLTSLVLTMMRYWYSAPVAGSGRTPTESPSLSFSRLTLTATGPMLSSKPKKFWCSVKKKITKSLTHSVLSKVVRSLLTNAVWETKFWSTRPKTDVPYMFYTKFHLPRPIFYLPSSNCTRIGEQASVSFPHWNGDIDLSQHWLIMACCLMAPSHDLNQCSFISKGVLWLSPGSIS